MSYRCFAFLGVLAVAVSAQDAHHQSGSALAVTALKGPASTDVTIVVSGESIPSSARKVKIKALDSAGEAVWVRDFDDVPLPSGSATFSFTDLSTHQTIDVSVKLDTDGGTVNLSQQATVLLRPDLVVSQTVLPEAALVGVELSMAAVVSETNGDLDAAFQVTMSINGIPAATQSTMVAAGGSANASFSHRFCIPGTYSIQFTIGGAVPGEYDTANNTATVELVVGATSPSGVSFLSYRGNTMFNYVELTSWSQFLRPARWPMSLSVDVCADGEPAVHFERASFNYAVRETSSIPSNWHIQGVPDSEECRHIVTEWVGFRTEGNALIWVYSVRIYEHNGNLQFATTWVGVLFQGFVNPATQRVDVAVNLSDADGAEQGYTTVALAPDGEIPGYAGLARGGHPEDVTPMLPQLPNYDGDLGTVPTPDPVADAEPLPDFGECPPPDFEGGSTLQIPGVSFIFLGGFELPPPEGGDGGDGGFEIPPPSEGEPL